MVVKMFEKLGDDIASVASGEGDAGKVLNIMSGGLNEGISMAADEAGLFKTEKPAEQKVERIEKTEEEKSKLREAIDNRAAQTEGLYDPSKLQTRQEGVSALGDALNRNTAQVDMNQLGGVRPTTVGPIGDRQTVQFDRSRVDTGAGQFQAQDTGPVSMDRTGLGQVGYQAGEGAQAQSALLQALQQQAAGQGPSVAQQQFQQANEAAIQAGMAQQASLRGGFDPAMARQIQMSQADLQAQAARDSAQARMQEQLTAQQTLANVAGTMEGQNIDVRQQDIQQREQDIQMAERDALLEQASKELGVNAEKYRADAAARAADQEITMATEVANLQDKAISQKFEAETEALLKQADLDSAAARTEFTTKADVLSKNMIEQNANLRTAYNGDVQAFNNDVNYANQMIMAGIREGASIADMKMQLEMEFIQDGIDQENAKIRAENAHNAAMVAWKQSINDMRTGIFTNAIGGAADAAAMVYGAPPGTGSAMTDAILPSTSTPMQGAANPTGTLTQQNQAMQQSWGLQSAPTYSGPLRP